MRRIPRAAAGDISYPAGHLGGTAQEWRAKKRQEWKAVMNALSAFELGAAYTTAGQNLYWVRQHVDRIWEDLQGEWVAWTLVKPASRSRQTHRKPR